MNLAIRMRIRKEPFVDWFSENARKACESPDAPRSTTDPGRAADHRGAGVVFRHLDETDTLTTLYIAHRYRDANARGM
jgi:hypothetical protein